MKISPSDLFQCCYLMSLSNKTGIKPEVFEELAEKIILKSQLKAHYLSGHQAECIKVFESCVQDQAVEFIAAIQTSQLEVVEIHIPRSHINDFTSHPGWWATFENLNLKIGQRVRFKLDDTKIEEAAVISYSQKPNFNKFSNWWILFYEPIKTTKSVELWPDSVSNGSRDVS